MNKRMRGPCLMASLVVLALTASIPTTAAASDHAAAVASGQLSPEIAAAMQRDLGLAPDQAERLVNQQLRAIALDTELPPRLGKDFGGDWFDPKSGKLVVAITNPARTREVEATGAEARVVKRGKAELDAIKAELDERAGAVTERGVPRTERKLTAENRAAVAGLAGWRVDPRTNSVVVTVLAGQRNAVAPDLVSRHGDAVRIEETTVAPATTGWDTMAGGDQLDMIIDGHLYWGCSAGFNMRVPNTNVGYMITAGHCGTRGYPMTGKGDKYFGAFVESWFPTYDDALLSNDRPSWWVQGPWVRVWPSDGFSYIVKGWSDAPIGTQICKAGRTTIRTCGSITGKDETIVVASGQSISHLTRHNACVEPGDSGGASYAFGADGILAEGVTSAATLADSDCLEKVGLENQSWYYPIADSLAWYGPTRGVELWTG